MLKRQISKVEHTALVPALQVEYVPDASGESYTLQASGFDDPAELRRAKDREKARAEAAESEVTSLKTKLDALGPDAQRKLQDISTIEKSWKDKEATTIAEHKRQLAQRDQFIENALVDTVASQIATELAGPNAQILIPHIKTRLKVEHVEGGSPLTRILDKDGRPTANNIADLTKEFAANPQFKVVVIAGKGTGGGAAGHQGGGAAGTPNTGTKKFNELNEAERIEYYKRDPEGFTAASKAQQVEQRDLRERRLAVMA